MRSFFPISRSLQLFWTGIFLILFSPTQLSALPDNTTDSSHSIVREAEVPFEVERGIFFITHENGEVDLREAYLFSNHGKENAEGQKNIWYLATTLPPMKGSQATITEMSALLLGSQGASLYLPPKNVEGAEMEGVEQSQDIIREQIRKRREALKDLTEKRKRQQDELRRLQADVDIISDMNRLVDAKEEADRRTQELEGAKKDKEVFQQALAAMKKGDVPKYFLQREAELTRQLADLAVTAKQAEQRLSLIRAKEISPERRRYLEELGRTADIEGLNRQYQALRTRRESLERQYQEENL